MSKAIDELKAAVFEALHFGAMVVLIIKGGRPVAEQANDIVRDTVERMNDYLDEHQTETN